MALTLQVQSLQCNVPHLIGMRDESKKAKFPVLPLVEVDFYFGIAPLSLLCWPMSQAVFMQYLPVCNGSECCGGRIHCFGSDVPSLSWQLLQGSFTQSQLRVFMCFFLWFVFDWFVSVSRTWGCWRSLQNSQPSCTLLKVRILLLPSFSCTVSLSISLFISKCSLFSLLSVTGLVFIHYHCSVNMIRANGTMDVVSWHGREEKQLGPGGRTLAWKSVSLLIFQLFFWTGLVELMAGMVQNSLVKVMWQQTA